MFRCGRCGVLADEVESLFLDGVMLTIHLPATIDEGRSVDWCRSQGDPVRPSQVDSA